MAADVRSLAAVYEVIGQPHPTSSIPPLRALRILPSSKRSKVLGIPEAWFSRATPAMRELCDSLIERLVRDHGYSTVPIEIPFLVEGQIAHAMVVLNDGATLLPNTRGLTAANRLLLALGRTTPATDFLLAEKLRRLLMQHLAHLWERHPGMLVVTPTTSCAGYPVRGGDAELRHGVSDGDRTIQTMEYCWLANFCGAPSITVPAGFVVPEGQGQVRAGQVAGPEVEGRVPVGLMATGEWAGEEALFNFALDAEEIGAERRARPPIWVDVVEKARLEKRANGVSR
jgi:Asp-tRNA(Asn)/Glu-tRNA(Gln) amidotransferase A subunit family amidase